MVLSIQHPWSITFSITIRRWINKTCWFKYWFLHRGTEKLIEQRNYLKAFTLFWSIRLCIYDGSRHSFCLAIEDLLQSTSYTSFYIQIRVLFDELTGLMNHFLSISTHSLDVGNMSPTFWAFEERENLWNFMNVYPKVHVCMQHFIAQMI